MQERGETRVRVSRVSTGGASMSDSFPLPLRRAALPLAIALVALTGLPGVASAQYFGRNKVVYEQFKWQVLKTEHFDIHYYPEEEPATQEAARLAERWYARLSSIFGREFTERKTIIFYA